MNRYNSLFIFIMFLAGSFLSSYWGYRNAKSMAYFEMNKALRKTLIEQKSYTISPDTIVRFRNNIPLEALRKHSRIIVNTNENNKITFATECSFQSIMSISEQRPSALMALSALMWAIMCIFKKPRDKELPIVATYSANPIQNTDFNTTMSELHKNDDEIIPIDIRLQEDVNGICFGDITYNKTDDAFYTKDGHEITFTPMQHQAMTLFFKNQAHQLSQKDICNALWPKKDDASDTLYTFIRRLKPILESQTDIRIECLRGRAYRIVSNQEKEEKS